MERRCYVFVVVHPFAEILAFEVWKSYVLELCFLTHKSSSTRTCLFLVLQTKLLFGVTLFPPFLLWFNDTHLEQL